MKFTCIVSTLLAIVYAASVSEEFKLLAYRTSDPLRYGTVYSQDKILYFGPDQPPLFGNLTSCGYLQFAEGDYAVVTRDGYLQRGSKKDAADGFSLKNGNLRYRDVNGFEAVHRDGKYLISTQNHKGGFVFFVKAQKVQSKVDAHDFRLTGACKLKTPSATLYSTS